MSEVKEETLDSIGMEYARCAQTYGDHCYRIEMLKEDAEGLKQKMKELNQRAFKLQQAKKEESDKRLTPYKEALHEIYEKRDADIAVAKAVPVGDLQ